MRKLCFRAGLFLVGMTAAAALLASAAAGATIRTSAAAAGQFRAAASNAASRRRRHGGDDARADSRRHSRSRSIPAPSTNWWFPRSRRKRSRKSRPMKNRPMKTRFGSAVTGLGTTADKDFEWVSGVWRVPPPNQRWVAGYWTAVNGGYSWVPGFWTPTPRRTWSIIRPAGLVGARPDERPAIAQRHLDTGLLAVGKLALRLAAGPLGRGAARLDLDPVVVLLEPARLGLLQRLLGLPA